MKSCMPCHKARMNVDLYLWILAGNEVGNAVFETLSEESIMAQFNYVGKELWQVPELPSHTDSVSLGFANCCFLPCTLMFEENGVCWMGARRWKLNTATFSTPAESALACSTLPFLQGLVCSVECTGLKLSICKIKCSVRPESCYLCRCVCKDTVLKLFHVLSSMPSSHYVQKASAVLWERSCAPAGLSAHVSCPLEPKGVNCFRGTSDQVGSNLTTFERGPD